ncbi:MAG: ribosome biogenesis GTPase Der [Bifidobacteriaceae bacterium]|jgi:GTP-binding protein|nr:ribosome biogenesis GTPase Der [Bifidobacteriaceae bacterium]
MLKVAIIGRPNVGKSTLINRILGKRLAVTQDQPGVTRDTINYKTNWNSLDFEIMDTGGWAKRVKGIDLSVAKQSENAINSADILIFLTDVNTGVTNTDEQMLKLIYKSQKQVILVVNKVDNQTHENETAQFYTLGLGEPQPISALHGRGIGDLLDLMVNKLKIIQKTNNWSTNNTIQNNVANVALIGKPNCGKSSLLNALLGEKRVTVNDKAGTTRDPVDQIIELNKRQYNFIDTAGIKKKQWTLGEIDYYSSIRTHLAIDRSDVVLFLIDSTQGVTEQDMKILSEVILVGKAIIVAFNKWDLLNEDQKNSIQIDIDTKLDFVNWAPQINFSAKTKWHINRIDKALVEVLHSYKKRITTAKINQFIKQITDAKPHPVRGGKQPRILYGSQVDIKPPKIIWHTTDYLTAPYMRFIENNLRKVFSFYGTPIKMTIKPRPKRSKGKS